MSSNIYLGLWAAFTLKYIHVLLTQKFYMHTNTGSQLHTESNIINPCSRMPYLKSWDTYMHTYEHAGSLTHASGHESLWAHISIRIIQTHTLWNTPYNKCEAAN